MLRLGRQFISDRLPNSASLLLAFFLWSSAALAEQGTWDPIAKDVLDGGGAMILYQGKVFCANGMTWDGSSLSRWSVYGVGAASFATDGTNLYAAGGVPGPGGQYSVGKWDGSAWQLIPGAGNYSPYGFWGYTVAWYGGALYYSGYRAAENLFYRHDGQKFTAVGDAVNFGITDETAVRAMLVHDDKLYVGSSFYGGATGAGVLSWNGTNWSTLGSGTNWAIVAALAVGGRDLYAGGGFNAIGGVAATNIARWDGTNWHALGLGLSGRVNAIACSGNKVYAGGNFLLAGDRAAHGLAVWDGAFWSALSPGLSRTSEVSNVSVEVRQLFVYGKDLLISGYFTGTGEMPSKGFAIWHPDGRPELNLTRAGDHIQLSWSADQTNAVLEVTDSLSASNWLSLGSATLGTNRFETTLRGSNRLFRLRQAP